MTPHSGGSVPRRVRKKEKKPERQSAAEVNRKLTEALKRLPFLKRFDNISTYAFAKGWRRKLQTGIVSLTIKGGAEFRMFLLAPLQQNHRPTNLAFNAQLLDAPEGCFPEESSHIGPNSRCARRIRLFQTRASRSAEFHFSQSRTIPYRSTVAHREM